MKTTERIDIAHKALPTVSGAIEPAVYVRDMNLPTIAVPLAAPAAEQRFRLAAVRLEAALEDRRPRRETRSLGRLVVITSPEEGDGKTTTALHLSVALARSLGRRVALVELDGHPGLAAMLGLPPGRGMADVMAGRATLDDVLVRADDNGPTIIPAGDAGAHSPSAAALLAPLNALREYFDYVITDCAALAGSADAAMLGRAADGVVMVVRAGATRGPALAGAMEAMTDAPIVGCIINDLDGAPGEHAAAPRSARIARTITDEDD